jgi:hypothetical protein
VNGASIESGKLAQRASTGLLRITANDSIDRIH